MSRPTPLVDRMNWLVRERLLGSVQADADNSMNNKRAPTSYSAWGCPIGGILDCQGLISVAGMSSRGRGGGQASTCADQEGTSIDCAWRTASVRLRTPVLR